MSPVLRRWMAVVAILLIAAAVFFVLANRSYETHPIPVVHSKGTASP